MLKPSRATGLHEGSSFYGKEAAIYEKFSRAEDAPNRILKALLPKLKNKIVLDIGCGTGKYAKLIAPRVKSYYGIDISQRQLLIAGKKTHNIRNVRLIRADITKTTKLQDNFFDVVIALWSINTINGYQRKRQALAEAVRTLKPGGMIYLIENHPLGMFNRIRGPARSQNARKYNRWLGKQGFATANIINTYFKFSSRKEAENIFRRIWGEDISRKVAGKKIAHKIVMFRKANRS